MNTFVLCLSLIVPGPTEVFCNAAIGPGFVFTPVLIGPSEALGAQVPMTLRILQTDADDKIWAAVYVGEDQL